MTGSDGDSMEIATLADGALKLLTNARQLYDEAVILRRAGRLSRSCFLHQISLEECAKIAMLGALAASILTGQKTDLNRFFRAFASHRAKNFTNAYYLPLSEAESAAREEKQSKLAVEAFRQLQREFHSEANTAKNASLYVDFRAGRFLSPSEQVSEDKVQNIAAANEVFLSTSTSKVELLRRWADKPEEVRRELGWLMTRLKKLATETDDPDTALTSSLDEALARLAR